MDNAKLQEIKEAAEKAAPGPWYCRDNGDIYVASRFPELEPCVARQVCDKNQEFIALMNPTTALALVAEIERLQVSLEKITDCEFRTGEDAVEMHDIARQALEGDS